MGTCSLPIRDDAVGSRTRQNERTLSSEGDKTDGMQSTGGGSPRGNLDVLREPRCLRDQTGEGLRKAGIVCGQLDFG
jgi:hypothetical protein